MYLAIGCTSEVQSANCLEQNVNSITCEVEFVAWLYVNSTNHTMCSGYEVVQGETSHESNQDNNIFLD